MSGNLCGWTKAFRALPNNFKTFVNFTLRPVLIINPAKEKRVKPKLQTESEKEVN